MTDEIEKTDKLPMPTAEELDAIMRSTALQFKRLDADVQKIAIAMMKMCEVTDALADEMQRQHEALVKAGLIGEE